jgi:hypothetical protein
MQTQLSPTSEKTEKEILNAQKRVIELGESIYALIKEETLGFAHDALDLALILKKRQWPFIPTSFQSQRETAQVPLKVA